MRLLQGFSIKNKLILIILVVSLLAITIGFSFVIIFDIKTFQKEMKNNTIINAKLVGEYCVVPMTFDQPEGVKETLTRLQSISSIANGYVYDQHQQFVASYNHPKDQEIPALSVVEPVPLSYFKSNYLHVFQPIIYRDQKYGTIYLKASTHSLNQKITQYILIMIALMMGLIGLSYFLALKLQNIISNPILKLANITEKISNEKDYSLRVDNQGSDEIGILYDGFNNMLEQIQLSEIERDKAEERLYFALARNKAILEAVPDIIMEVDFNKIYTWANKAGFDFFGNDVIGKDVSCYLIGDQNFYKKVEPLFKGDEKVIYVESWQKRKDSEKRLLAWWCRVLKDEEGNVTGALSSARDITEQKKVEEKIRASLREKEILLQEIHHRVKNNLQIIYSLLGLQSEYIKNKQAREVFRESQNRIKSMALIHEKLYQSKNFAEIDLTDYVSSLTTNLFHTHHVQFGKIRMKTAIKDVYLGLETAIPCGLIINELVTNALKYAFPDGNKGSIHLGLQLDSDDKYTLIVRDNGVGLPKGLDIHNTKTLGLQLVVSLVEQLEGTIEINRKRGSKFTIRFGDLKYVDRIS